MKKTLLIAAAAALVAVGLVPAGVRRAASRRLTRQQRKPTEGGTSES